MMPRIAHKKMNQGGWKSPHFEPLFDNKLFINSKQETLQTQTTPKKPILNHY